MTKSYMVPIAVAAFGLATITATAPVMATSASSVAAHRAFYDMELGDRMPNATIVNVKGRSAYVIERDCEGWRSIEDYVLEFVGEGGSNERVLSHFESWEADSGDKYSFDISENSSFMGRKEFGGFAQRGIADAGGDAGIAAFSIEPDAEIALPAETHFPIQHLEEILTAAETGQTILAATLFTGAEPDDALMKTNTVVGVWQETDDGAILGTLDEAGYWPVRIAYFKPSSQSAEPEYEINFAMQRNGIVRSYEIDYGDFSIKADLRKIEAVDAPVCS